MGKENDILDVVKIIKLFSGSKEHKKLLNALLECEKFRFFLESVEREVLPSTRLLFIMIIIVYISAIILSKFIFFNVHYSLVFFPLSILMFLVSIVIGFCRVWVNNEKILYLHTILVFILLFLFILLFYTPLQPQIFIVSLIFIIASLFITILNGRETVKYLIKQKLKECISFSPVIEIYTNLSHLPKIYGKVLNIFNKDFIVLMDAKTKQTIVLPWNKIEALRCT